MFSPSIPAPSRARAPLRVLDLFVSSSDETPQTATWQARATPAHVSNHSLVVNAPPLGIDRINDKDVVMCSRRTLVSKVYEKLLMPRYSRVPVSQQAEHGFIYNEEAGDHKITVAEFAKLFDRRVRGPSGTVYNGQPLASLCKLVNAIEQAKGGIAEAFRYYIIMTAIQFWLIANDRFMFYNPVDPATFSQAYPTYIFPVSIFTDFALEPRLVENVPPSKSIWELARDVTISEFALWLYCSVSDFCLEQECPALYVKREDAVNDIDNKLHRNYELFLTSRRVSRLSCGDMRAYVADLNEAVRTKCAEYHKEVSSYTFKVEVKHWYPQQTQHRVCIEAPSMSIFAGAAVYFFSHPQFTPEKFVLPECTVANELDLRVMRWWMQWWCPKSMLDSKIAPSFNNYAWLLRARETQQARASQSDANEAAVAALSSSASGVGDSKRLELIPDFNSNSALPDIGASAASSAHGTGKSTARKKSGSGRQNMTIAFWKHLTAWDTIDYTRLQYAVLHGGRRGPLSYVIDKGDRDPRHVHDLMRHDMSPLGLTAGAVLGMVHTTPLQDDVFASSVRTAKEWMANPPKGWRLQPAIRGSDAAPTAAVAAAAADAKSPSQVLITHMFTALATADASDSKGPQQPVAHMSSAFPFDYLVLGSDHPDLSTWIVRDSWLDEPASDYETYLVMSLWYRVVRFPATRWFNLLQVLLLLSGDEATAYRCVLLVWCNVHGRTMPVVGRSTKPARMSELRVCRAFLSDLCAAYVEEVSWVHSHYTKLTERGREHKERASAHNLNRFNTYSAAVKAFHGVTISSEHGFARFVPQHTLQASSVKRGRKCADIIAKLPQLVSANQWLEVFNAWEACHKLGAQASVAKASSDSTKQMPAAEMMLHALAHMWMHTWYCVLSVKSMCWAPCFIRYHPMVPAAGEYSPKTEYHKRNRRSGWSRYVSLARKAARESGRLDERDLGEDDVITAQLVNLFGGEGSPAVEYLHDYKADRDSEAHRSNDLARDLQNLVKQFIGSPAGRRALTRYLEHKPQLDATSALMVQVAAHCMDIGSVPSGDLDSSPSAPLWQLHQEYLQTAVTSAVPMLRDRCQHLVIACVEFVCELLFRCLRDNTHVWGDDWATIKDVMDRGILSTNCPRRFPSTTKIVGGILSRILASLPASAAATDVDTSDASAVARVSILTRSVAVHKLNQSKTHPLALQVFAAFPYLLR